MKKILIVSALSFAALFQISCADNLEVNPTNRASGGGMMTSTTTAITALNGVYRHMLIDWGWSVLGNQHQAFGPQSYTMMADLMGEDMIMRMGSGWFFYDYVYDVKEMFTSTTWRPYDMWTFYYTIIANVNAIIAAEDTMEGSEEDVAYIIGQAYAIRAFCYHYLALNYCRTYKGHETDKGVPLYTDPTVAGTVGKPRGTLQDVYTLVVSDIDKSIELLATTRAKDHPSHIDYRVAHAIKARICMHTDDWDAVLTSSQEAQKPFADARAFSIGTPDTILSGLNNASDASVMWGAEIIQTQSTTNPQFLAHMDWAIGSYGSKDRAPKTINVQLYNKMSATDARRGWWESFEFSNEDEVDMEEFIQVKYRFSDYTNWLGDRIIMRVEEMVLMEAEALCRLGRDGDAIAALKRLMARRDPNYDTNKTGTAMGALVTDETGSLLEEIITQRRIELWGEYGRVWDIRRLKQGLVRTAAMGHTTDGINATNALKTDNPETWDWVMTIPIQEFNSNPSLSQGVDQNPIDSGI